LDDPKREIINEEFSRDICIHSFVPQRYDP